MSADTQNKIDSAMEMIEDEKFTLEVFDNIIIRKLIECVKVLSKEELLIIFKGGVEIKSVIGGMELKLSVQELQEIRLQRLWQRCLKVKQLVREVFMINIP